MEVTLSHFQAMATRSFLASHLAKPGATLPSLTP